MKRIFLIVVGTISLGLGILGMFVPLLPTVPFLLLTASCYLRSSEKLYNRLMAHPVCGKIITDYQKNKRIPLRIKIWSLTLLWLSISLSAFLFVETLWVRILLLGIAAGVTIHILSYKS